MHLRHQVQSLAGSALLGLWLPAFAANWQCAVDLNGDGLMDGAGETASCITSASGQLCPIQATACTSSQTVSCVPGPSQALGLDLYIAAQGRDYLTVDFDLKTGVWTQSLPTDGGSIQGVIPQVDIDDICTGNHTVTLGSSEIWSNAPLSGGADSTVFLKVLVAPSCANGLTGRLQVEDDVKYGPNGPTSPYLGGHFHFDTLQDNCSTNTAYNCPLGSQYACVDNAGVQQCSQNSCVDLAITPPVISSPFDSSMYVNDGAQDSSGACIGQVQIFTGRSMRCEESGTRTAFHDCCKDTGKILSDDQGQSASNNPANQINTLSNLAQSMTQGNNQLTQALVLSQPVTSAATAAATYTTNLMGSLAGNPLLNPANMLTAVQDYFQQSCDQLSTETGVLNGSGFCYQVGTFCEENWPLLGCVQQAKSFCCFNSKLAKIIHEQGRAQLQHFNNNTWGNPDQPECRGFTPEEFQAIDWSKIDMSGYINDLVPNTNIQINQELQNGVQNYMQKLQ